MKLLLWILCSWFWSYGVFVVISFPLWINLNMAHLLLFFSVQRPQLFLTNLFSVLLFDRYILAIQQIITHGEHLRYYFWSIAISWTASEALVPWQNNRKWLKQPQSHFHQAIFHKGHHFLLFWCMFCTANPDIWSSSENINSTARVSRLSFRFLWLWINQNIYEVTAVSKIAFKRF